METQTTSQQFARNVSLDEQTIEIVEKLNEKMGLRNFSAALRIIIREWASQEAAQSRNGKGKGKSA